MTHPAIADKILGYIDANPTVISGHAVAKALNEDRVIIANTLGQIFGYFPMWFKTQNLSYGDDIGFILKSEFYGHLKGFIATGGFTGEATRSADKAAREDARSKAEMDAFAATVAQAEIAKKAARQAWKAAVWSISIAVASLIVAAIALLK